jgi:hypothetical protein
MPGLVPGIHVLLFSDVAKTWMAGTKPGHDDCGIFNTTGKSLSHNQKCSIVQLLFEKYSVCDFCKSELD